MWHWFNAIWHRFSCFNPHTHAGCDYAQGSLTDAQYKFQSTHPRRVWLSLYWTGILQASFNPHTHAGCDDLIQVDMTQILLFQSTHPRRVWQILILLRTIMFLFQSTHPRRVWPYFFRLLELPVYVSIHTPTQGVTYWRESLNGALCFNPHTHAGCDPDISDCMFALPQFQSTHPRRVWLSITWRRLRSPNVSIHTPTQGVTDYMTSAASGDKFQSTHPRRVWQAVNMLPIFTYQFQSTHPRRVWPNTNITIISITKFQSTHPRRVWHVGYNINWSNTCFNPHTHAGCDWYWRESLNGALCFNPHTHAGCDLCYFSSLSDNVGFNPHTHAGCDCVFIMLSLYWTGFNPHTHAGCDTDKRHQDGMQHVSIHTPTQGVTLLIKRSP